MIHPSAVVFPGTEMGEDVVVEANAVVGKQPSLGRRSTAARDEQPGSWRALSSSPGAGSAGA